MRDPIEEMDRRSNRVIVGVLLLIVLSAGMLLSGCVQVEKHYTLNCPPSAAQTGDNGAHVGCTLNANSATEADAGIESALTATITP